MTRKFLFCFPLRVGNVVFGFVVIIIAVAVLAFSLFELADNLVNGYRDDTRFRDFQNLEKIFGSDRDILVTYTIIVYYMSYIIVSLLLLLFSILLACGAWKANSCLVSTFFVYSFFHLFLTIGLIVWEALTAGWIQLGLILLSDVLLIVCLFGVKYLMEAIRTGNIYSRPGEIYDKY